MPEDIKSALMILHLPVLLFALSKYRYCYYALALVQLVLVIVGVVQEGALTPLLSRAACATSLAFFLRQYLDIRKYNKPVYPLVFRGTIAAVAVFFCLMVFNVTI